MNALSDETLMAYADSELDDEEREMVERVLEQNPDARAKVDDFRRSGVTLKKYAAILSEPVSDELIETIRTLEKSSKIVPFPRTPTRSNWMRLAASLILGVSLGGGGMKIALDQRNDQSQVAELQFRGGKVGPESEVQTANAPLNEMMKQEMQRLVDIQARIQLEQKQLTEILEKRQVVAKVPPPRRPTSFMGTEISVETSPTQSSRAEIEVLQSRGETLLIKAEHIYKQVLSELEKDFGPDHPSVAASLNNLANVYRTQGHNAKTEPLYKRAIAIYEKALGPDHPSVATNLYNLAALYREQGRYAEAEPLELRAKEIRARHPEKK